MSKINLSHGNGASETADLIDSVFMKYFKNKYSLMEDSAVLPFTGEKLAFTTDSFVVKPLFFPGGDIGRLAVCGTINDLLTTGGKPLYLSASFIIEENTEFETIEKIVKSMRETAKESNVFIVTGDTKVIEGNGGIYINTSGIGTAGNLSLYNIKSGDVILINGTLGDHHACILSQRMKIKNNIKSDAAPLTEIINLLLENNIKIRGLRDITRGGLATVLNEAAEMSKLSVEIDETSLPVSEEVNGFCKILGLDPLYMGNEGKMMFVVQKEYANKALNIIKNCKYGENSAIIGRFITGSGVVLNTKIGGQRKLPPLSGEGLPRIC